MSHEPPQRETDPPHHLAMIGAAVEAVIDDIEFAVRTAEPLLRQAVAAEIVAAIEAYPGARGPAIDDPRDPRRSGLDVARRIARDLGKAATT